MSTRLSAVEKIKVNSKFFFKYVEDKFHIKSQIGPLSHDGEVFNNPKIMCNMLKSQFEYVYSVPINNGCIYKIEKESGPRYINDLKFSIDDIFENIMEISRTTAPGSDGIPVIFLRECAQQLELSIFLMWRASLDAGRLPEELKHSKVVGDVIPPPVNKLITTIDI